MGKPLLAHEGRTEAVIWHPKELSDFKWSPGNAMIVDAAAEPDFLAKALETGLDFVSLFTGENAKTFANEAPYLVVLGDDSDPGPARQYAVELIAKQAAIGLETQSDPETLRRHFRKWTSVTVPAETNETGAPLDVSAAPRRVHFRFYDPRIFLAFIATLSPAQAAGFFGPVTTYLVFDHEVTRAFERSPEAEAQTAPKRGIGELYAITPVQMQAFTTVASDTFREDLFGFFRGEFGPETAQFSDEELRKRINDGIGIAQKIGDTRRGSTLNMVYLAIFRPDIPADPDIWAHATQAENQKQHAANLFIEFLQQTFDDMETERRFAERLGLFWGEAQ